MATPTELNDAGSDSQSSRSSEGFSLSAEIYSKFDEVRQILSSSTSTASADTMREFDMGGGPQIYDSCAADDGDGVDEAVYSIWQGDQMVRKAMECGPDVVTAYDDAGNPHQSIDEKITSLPVDFSGIPDWRRTQLNETASSLVDKYTSGDDEMSFNDIANVMQDISKMNDLTEVEKCRVWSDVHRKMQKDDVDITNDDEYASMVDTWKGSSDPWHALISLDDGYHADFLINQSPEAASQAILNHENGGEVDNMGFFRGLVWKGAKMVYGVNEGDINASEGQLSALRALRTEGTFAAYAAEWKYQFVRQEGAE